jgi:multiple sugar transport system ATP-binding protein
MASLTFYRVGKTYFDSTVAVANASIDIAEGEFVVLVGPSGCGKSTLLRVAAGLEELTSGSVLLGGVDVSRLGPRQRDIAMVFQNYALYPHMTVFENMAFGLQQRRLPKEAIARQVQEVARLLDLTRYLDRKPGMLSGGQRQRVAMGRAIVRQPAAFLMDEPLSNLDAKLRVQMRAELKLLTTRLGVTTLYVTHDQVEAMTMGDRVAVLKPVQTADECNLQQVDTPQMLYDQPANLFVAGFVGSPAMNFLRVRLAMAGDELVAECVEAGPRFIVPAEVRAQRPGLLAQAGREVVLGVRPEAFHIAAESPLLIAEILVTEALGSDTFVFFDLASAMATVDASSAAVPPRVTARLPPDRQWRRGDCLPLGVDLARLHWFAIDTGLAIH